MEQVQEKLSRAEAATARANATSAAAQSKLVSGVEKMRVETQRYEAAVSACARGERFALRTLYEREARWLPPWRLPCSTPSTSRPSWHA